MLFVWTLLLSGVVSAVFPADNGNPAVAIREPGQTAGYYVIHWPGNTDSEVFFASEFMGRIQNNSLRIPINESSRHYHRYSIVSGNRTVFSDTLPEAPVSGVYVEVFPRVIQTRLPGPSTNDSVRTYRIYWPDDGVNVYIGGEYGGTITGSLATIEIPGRDIPGHPEYPETISFRYPDNRREQSFSVDIIPEVGGVAEYYLYWSAPFMYPAEPSRTGIHHTLPGPLWADRFDTYNVNFEIASSGNAGVLGTEQNGVARMFSPDGASLWSYYDYGKSTRVAVNADGSLCVIGIRRDAYTRADSAGEVLLADRNGTILWKKELAHGIDCVSISPDGAVILVTFGNTAELLDRTGSMIGSFPVSNYRTVSVSDNGIAGSGTNSIQYFSRNGTQLWSYPVNSWISDISLSFEGISGAAVSNDHVYYFTRDKEITWQRSSESRMAAVSISADGRHLAGASQYRLHYYDKEGNRLWYYEYPGYVNDVALSGDGLVVAASFSPDRAAPNQIVLFDAEGRKLWGYFVEEKNIFLHRVEMSSDGNYIGADAGGTLYFFNRWGNATIIQPMAIPVTTKNLPADNSTKGVSSSFPSRPAPVPAVFPIIATGCIVLMVANQRMGKNE
ncbi:WD40 repeat domain-containing protein [Methanoregula sp.]|uniref:WD40 repeat domain-containing protein n=1 Tax=Methanoregula sp. TaxID=2052170 RepID=UPI00356677A7